MAAIDSKTRDISTISRKNRGLWTVYRLSRVEIFENTVLYPCGWIKTDDFKNDHVTVLGTKKRACHAHQKSRIFKLLCLFLWRDKKFKKRTMWTRMFLKTEKRASFFKQKRMRVDGVWSFHSQSCKLVLTFESVDNVLRCDHWHVTSLTVLSLGVICFSTFYKMTKWSIDFFLLSCLILTLTFVLFCRTIALSQTEFLF